MCLGVPGRIEDFIEGPESGSLSRKGRVSFGGVTQEVHLGFVPEAQVGDYVIVHVGVAISCLEEADALHTLALIRQMESEIKEEGIP